MILLSLPGKSAGAILGVAVAGCMGYTCSEVSGVVGYIGQTCFGTSGVIECIGQACFGTSGVIGCIGQSCLKTSGGGDCKEELLMLFWGSVGRSFCCGVRAGGV